LDVTTSQATGINRSRTGQLNVPKTRNAFIAQGIASVYRVQADEAVGPDTSQFNPSSCCFECSTLKCQITAHQSQGFIWLDAQTKSGINEISCEPYTLT
jgi:hypothetical protein